MSKFVIEGVMDVDTEDSGQAKIGTISGEDENSCLFVRIQSWDEKAIDGEGDERNSPEIHKEFKTLEGKKLRVTIEVIE